MRSAPFWGFTQRRFVVHYRHFGTPCRSHLRRSRSPRSCNSTVTGKQASEMLTFEPRCSVYMVTGYGPEDRSSVSNRDWNFIITMSEPAVWPIQACSEMDIGVSSVVDNAAGQWRRPLTPHEVLMLRIYTICLVSPYVLMA